MGSWARSIGPGLAAATVMFSLIQAAAMDVSQPQKHQYYIAQLIQELGSSSFVTRQRATRELTDLGIETRAALLAAANDADAEIRGRARAILAAVSESDFRDRLEAFAADYDGHHHQTLPGWDQFSSQFGESRIVRQLFVEMQRSEPELLEALAKGPKPATESLEARGRAILQQLMQNPNRDGVLSLGTVASLLFVGSSEGVSIDEQLSMQFYGWIYQPGYQKNARSGLWSGVLKKLLGRWILKDGNSAAIFQNLMLAASFELKSEGLTVASKTLGNEAGPAPIRQYAILTIGKFGGKEHLPLIEKCLQDATNCGMVQAQSPPQQIEIQIRDVALAVLIHLTGQRLRDYGYVAVQPSPQTLFQVGTLTFRDAAQRDAALKKWSQWRAEHPDS